MKRRYGEIEWKRFTNFFFFDTTLSAFLCKMVYCLSVLPLCLLDLANRCLYKSIILWAMEQNRNRVKRESKLFNPLTTSLTLNAFKSARAIANTAFFCPMNDFPVIWYPCFAHRILGSPGGKHCQSLQRNVWRGVVSALKAVSLDIECRILPWFYEKRRWIMLVRWKFKFLCD